MGNMTFNDTTTFTPEARYYAQPYDLDARGFFFRNREDYQAKRKACKNAFGSEVEEFELTFVGNDGFDHALFEALSINQANISCFMDKIDEWDSAQKIALIIAVGEGGYHFNIHHDDPDDIDVHVYSDITMKDLAEQFVDDGLFGDIPKSIAAYIDYDAIARDLGHDYTETAICGETFVYRLA